MDLINKHIDKIIELCQKFNVIELSVFGSILTSSFNSNSDIDMIIKLDNHDPIDYADNYFNFKFALELLLKRKIDLLEYKTIKNKTFQSLVNHEKVLIYDQQSESVA